MFKICRAHIYIYDYRHKSKRHVIPTLFAAQICFTPWSSSRTEPLSPPQFFSSDCFKGSTICKSVWGRKSTSPYPLTVQYSTLGKLPALTSEFINILEYPELTYVYYIYLASCNNVVSSKMMVIYKGILYWLRNIGEYI